jgi:hypothetical protein
MVTVAWLLQICDQVKPLEDWEREAWRKLPVDDKPSRGDGCACWEAGYNSVERICRPTAEINGIGGISGQ